jgi:protein involved in polysaccharide export with SLBB domain
MKAVQPDGRIVIRLRPLDAFAGTVDDIELEPGDRLNVPQVPQYVSTLGEVYNRTSLLYEPGKTVADYLSKVGGIKPTANEDEIYLVQIDGTVISNTQNQFVIVLTNGQTKRFKDFFAVQPQPGDSIVVPRRTVSPATLRNTRDIVQIIFQGVSSLGIIAALLASL